MKRSSFVTADTADRTAANVSAFDAAAGTVEAALAAAPAEATKAYENATRFSMDNIDAMVRASTAFNRALENLTQAWSTLARETLEASADAATAMYGARSIPEAIELQASLARSTVERFVAHGTKFSEASIAAGKEAFEPIHARATETFVALAKPVDQLLTKSLRAVA
jgi:phasin family protein